MHINKSNDEDELNTSESFKVFSKPNNHTHNVYLSNSISHDNNDYLELLQFLKNDAKNGDLVNIHLANFGGSVHAGLQLCHAIQMCKATTINYVNAPCYSMGAILALTADGLAMAHGTFLMFHNYSGFEVGKGAEMTKAITEFNKHFQYSLDHFCYPFLTKAELRRIHSDRDLYVHADDEGLKKRIERHYK